MIDKQLQVYRESNPGQLLLEKQMDFKDKSTINSPNNNFDEDDDLLAAVCSPPRKAVENFMPQKVRLAHDSYEILLLVDTQETAG